MITLPRTPGPGNSPHQMQRKLEKQHHMRWLRQMFLYLIDCKGFTNKDLVVALSFAKPASPMAVPSIPVATDGILSGRDEPASRGGGSHHINIWTDP